MGSKAGNVCLRIRTSRCTGCKSCEIACSFNLASVCNPAISRIKITRHNKTGEITCSCPPSCPECVFGDKPPCVEACVFGALKMGKGPGSLKGDYPG